MSEDWDQWRPKDRGASAFEHDDTYYSFKEIEMEDKNTDGFQLVLLVLLLVIASVAMYKMTVLENELEVIQTERAEKANEARIEAERNTGYSRVSNWVTGWASPRQTEIVYNQGYNDALWNEKQNQRRQEQE